MSSPAWNLRRSAVRQRMAQRPWLRSLKAQGITWPPVEGQVVCDCRFLHLKVTRAWPDVDDFELEDGNFCGLACLDPLDHAMADHPEGYRNNENASHPHLYAEPGSPLSSSALRLEGQSS